MSRARAAPRARAMEQFRQWRALGVPPVITADEAWRLTGGRVGRKGDYWTPVPLSRCAVVQTQRRR